MCYYNEICIPEKWVFILFIIGVGFEGLKFGIEGVELEQGLME